MTIPSPDAGQVRIQVEAFRLNFADVLARLGLYQDAPPLPAILGFDVSGRVNAVGSGVQKLCPGMRVVGMTRFGGYASQVVTNVSCVAPIPENFNPGAATALATQYSTAWLAAMEMACLQTGDRVLIHAAAGGVRTALVQIAKLQGCTIYGTTGSQQKLNYLKRIGVDYLSNVLRTISNGRICTLNQARE